MNTNEGQQQQYPPQYPQYSQPRPRYPQPQQLRPQPMAMAPPRQLLQPQAPAPAPVKHLCDFCQTEFKNKKKLELHYKEFHHNLFNCCSAGSVNCLGAFLGCGPCLAAGARNDFDGSNFCFNFCCVSEPATRNIIREGYGINGSCVEDILKSVLCEPCSAIQLVAETRERGSIKENGPLRQQMN